MAISDFLASLLSLDTYNRGYNSGISDNGDNDPDGLGEFGQIGNASIIDIDLPANSESNNFYATAYELGGQIVISYRGTDQLGADIVPTDFPIIGGDFNEPQLRLAVEFYQSVRAENPGAQITLTGHSLGGALAGFVGGLFLEEANVVDHINFQDALFNFVSSWNLVRDFLDFPNVAQATSQYAIVNDLDEFDPANRELLDFFGEQWTVINEFNLDSANDFNLETITDHFNGNISSSLINGSIAQNVNGTIPNPEFVLPEVVGSFFEGTLLNTSVQAHNVALNVVFQFAEEQIMGGMLTADNFESIFAEFTNAIGSNVIGATIGADNFDGPSGNPFGDPGSVLIASIAYSALDSGNLIFGDTGIRAMFNDLNDLGQVYNAGIINEANTFFSSPLVGVSQRLVDISVQYAGALALNEVTRQSVNTSFNLNAVQGIFDLIDNVFSVDISSVLWENVLRINGSTLALPDITSTRFC